MKCHDSKNIPTFKSNFATSKSCLTSINSFIMIPRFIILFVSVVLVHSLNAQDIQSPKEYLGHEIGERFTYHHQVVGYFEMVSALSSRVKLIEYGRSYENRPLIAAILTSPVNHENLERIRLNNLLKTGLLEGKADGTQLPIVWLSYNIHGNEASGTETALKALYYLVSSDSKQVMDWLDKMVIIIDPCLNPDGREKYAVWFGQATGQNINFHNESWEYQEPWPGSRVNHYLFDLNRDWAWQTQAETRQRLWFYQQWMPHVHIDFHEMGHDNPYFFGPGAKPYHKAMTDWQAEFQKILGAGLSGVFDERKELYFTAETFDLFSPAFGDTWPTFNGALGFTFEQGGGSAAGMAVITNTGDTLTLKNRVANQYASTMGTLSKVYEFREKIIVEFNRYFAEGIQRFPNDYQSYLIKGTANQNDIKALLQLLDNNQIKYYHPAQAGRNISGYDYFTRNTIQYTLLKNDIVVPVNQPHSHLVKVLFEPEAKFNDTVSYDLTAWSLPYVYNLPALAVKSKLPVHLNSKPVIKFNPNSSNRITPYAYLVKWESFQSVKFLSGVLKNKITVRYAQYNFETGKEIFPKGSLVINLAENKNIKGLDSIIISLANLAEVTVYNTSSGKVDKGKDLGSASYRLIKPLKIALIKGRGVSGNSAGELWYYFDKEINYPVALIDIEQFPQMNTSSYDLVILPSGNYPPPIVEAVSAFVKNGGRVIVMERGLQAFEKIKELQFGKVTLEYREKMEKEKLAEKKDPDSLLIRFEDRRKIAVGGISASSIYRLSLDNSHPFSFGIGSSVFLSKRNSSVYPYLPETAFNIGYFLPDAHISGFAGSRLKKQLSHSLAIGMEFSGKGSYIYITDSPFYRSFYHGGKLLFGNMVFLESSISLQQRYEE